MPSGAAPTGWSARRAAVAARDRLGIALDSARDRWRNPAPVGRIALNVRPTRSPYGGGNQWALQMTERLRAGGYSVGYDLDRPTDVIIIVDAILRGTASFGLEAIESYVQRRPEALVVHRVNENDLRKQTDFMDRALAAANALADHTVFISAWLRDYCAERWFDLRKPHRVIVNGADPSVFHPRGGAEWTPRERLRLVTHHWSTHPMKGFDVYEQLDGLIADGALPDTELWIIGHRPSEMRWRAARTFPLMAGTQLAAQLRRAHVAITASRWDPGPMHPVEALQCGLPVLYHADGGGIVEQVGGAGIAFRDDVGSAVRRMREEYAARRAAAMATPWTGRAMADAYVQAIETALHRHRSGRESAGGSMAADAVPAVGALPHA